MVLVALSEITAAAEAVKEIVQQSERRECGEPMDDGSGRVCRRMCAVGRDYHGGGHWFAAPDLDGEEIRMSTARWMVSGKQPGEAS